MAGRQELDTIAESVRAIKDAYNVEWDDKSHPQAIETDLAIRGFDQLMDQVLYLVECYQKFDQAKPDATIATARGARKEALKAACEFFESVASRLVNEAKQLIQNARPLPKELLEIHTRVRDVESGVRAARRKWERDDYAGLEELREAIETVDGLIEQIKLVSTATEPTEEREQRMVATARWQMWAAWAGILLTLALSIGNCLRNAPQRGGTVSGSLRPDSVSVGAGR